MKDRCTLLIVDDHDAFRASAARLLAADGFTVIGEAADGESAVSAARSLSPDVILLDVQLPDIDGFAVADRVLAAARDNGHVPAIVLTSSRDASDYGPSVARSGARGFIGKADLSGAALRALTGEPAA
ncbi:MAG: response regulator transcription factor [Actinobacteria bacterium]|nr:response regulator transcription factor [Actinomycetota bacterium]